MGCRNEDGRVPAATQGLRRRRRSSDVMLANGPSMAPTKATWRGMTHARAAGPRAAGSTSLTARLPASCTNSAGSPPLPEICHTA